jgi:hypothetical protein
MTFSQLEVLKTKREQAFHINFTRLVWKCKQFIVQMPFNLYEIVSETMLLYLFCTFYCNMKKTVQM